MTPSGATVHDRLEATLARIARDNSRNCIFVSLDDERAREAAAQSDARKAAGEALGPLDGLLIAIKDNLAVAGLPWTAGVGAYRERIAGEDSGVVQRLRSAGAVIVGTVNLHEGALGATTDNPHFGRCINPLRDGYTPGGSSGGSAAAVAGGYVDMAVGTDTMGSVRIPAAYCGVAGFKPTDGLVGRQGLAWLSASLDSIGPIARTVSLLRASIDVMAGRDDDARSLGPPADWANEDVHSMPPLSDYAFGVPQQIADSDCEPAVLEGLERTRNVLEAAGASTIDVDLAEWHPGSARRGGLMLAEAEGAVAMADLLDPETEGVSDAFRAFLTYGASLTSARLVDAIDRIARARAACHRALRRCDALLMPTAPQRAFAHGGPVPESQADLTALANFAGCPALSLPVAVGEGELPAAVQLVGAPWQDLRVLAIGEAIETALAA